MWTIEILRYWNFQLRYWNFSKSYAISNQLYNILRKLRVGGTIFQKIQAT